MTERLKVPVIIRTRTTVTLAHFLTRGHPGGWTVTGLAELTGLRSETIRTTLKKWADMGLLASRRISASRQWSGKTVFVYRVVLKRIAVLDGLARHYPIG
jgi:hypothetical protein